MTAAGHEPERRTRVLSDHDVRDLVAQVVEAWAEKHEALRCRYDIDPEEMRVLIAFARDVRAAFPDPEDVKAVVALGRSVVEGKKETLKTIRKGVARIVAYGLLLSALYLLFGERKWIVDLLKLPGP